MFDASNATQLATLRERLSPERLAPYDAAAGGSLTAGLALYEWNTCISAAFYTPLQGIEVALRNALHRELTTWHAAKGCNGEWYDNPMGVLDARALNDIQKAKERIWGQGDEVRPSRLVAELNFGFWRYLLSAHYEPTMWIPALRHAFPDLRPPRRRDVAGRIGRLHHLRNRIAHHMPIHGRDLTVDHRDLLFVAAAICPCLRAWIEQASTVPDVLAKRPR